MTDPGQRTREEVLVERYKRAEAEYNDAAGDVSNFFMPLLKTVLNAKDFDLAKQLLQRCPDHVTRCFMMDQISQARKTG